jgi:tetratricopeptide (TPR) repeat protein
MALTFLTYTFFAGGIAAILYSMVALFSLMNHTRVQKVLSGKYLAGADMQANEGEAFAEAFWERAKVLLQNGRFDAALADCKRALEINPNHADAKRLWEHLFPPGLVSRVPAGKALLLAAEAEKACHIDEKAVHESEPKQAKSFCSG